MSWSQIRDGAFGGFVMGVFFLIAIALGVVGAFFFLKWYFTTVNLKSLLLDMIL